MWQTPDLLFRGRIQDREIIARLAPLAIDIQVQVWIGAHESDYKYISPMATKYSKLDAKDFARENMRGIWAAALNPFKDDLSSTRQG